MKKKLILKVFLALTIISCKNQSNEEHGLNIDNKIIKEDIAVNKTEENIELDFFESIPDTIDGCNYVFRIDTVGELSKKSILISNYDYAMIKIKGEVFYMRRDTVESIQLSNKRFKEVYHGGGVKTIIDFEEVGGVDESFEFKGIISVKRGNIEVSKKVLGEGGC